LNIEQKCVKITFVKYLKHILSKHLLAVVSVVLVVVLIIYAIVSGPAKATVQVVFDTPGQTSWTVPLGVTEVTVEVWGGGGGGGGTNKGAKGASGGGGGAYSKKSNIAVTPGNTYTVNVGAGGAGGTNADGLAGGDSWFKDTSTVLAKGGQGGKKNGGSAPGGQATAGIGDIKSSGGNSSPVGNNSFGTGGGSSAGPGGPGNNSTGQTGATAPAGGGNGGNGGSAGADGSGGFAPGGGGGGGGKKVGNQVTQGGNGAPGKVVITYTPPTFLTVKKIVIPDSDSGLFNLQIDGQTEAPNVGGGGTTGPILVSPGDHTVSETAGTGTDLTDYVTTIGGACNPDGSVTLSEGDSKTCTITNTKKGSITVTKIANPGDGPFEITLNGGNSQFLSNGSYTYSKLLPGSYTVAENPPQNWQGSSSVSCSNGATGTISVTFNLNAGENVSCTFNNTEFGSISGRKFEDMNADGDGTSDPGLAGWTIKLYQNQSQINSTLTDNNGNYIFSGLLPGNYSVCEELSSGWFRSLPADSDCYEINLLAGQNVTGKDFGNYQKGSISGIKFNDENGNGVLDSGEIGLAGWTIFLDGTSLSTQTGNDGSYQFSDLVPGNYTVKETLQTSWVQISPASGSIVVTLHSGENVTDKNFGNEQDVTPPASIFNNPESLDHKIITQENTNLSLSGVSSDDFGVASVVLKIQKVGDENSISNYPAASFFNVFMGIDCSNITPISTEEISFSNQNNNSPFSWQHDFLLSADKKGIYCFKAVATDIHGNTEETAIAGPIAFIPTVTTSEESIITTAISQTGFTVSWTTDSPATSRVIYDTISHPTLGEQPNYGYAFSTPTDSNLVTNHSISISGLNPNTTYYFRTVSAASPESVSSEQSVTTLAQVPTQAPPQAVGGGATLLPETLAKPALPLKILINNDEPVTIDRNVLITLIAGGNVEKFSLSNWPDFRDARQENFIAEKTLTAGLFNFKNKPLPKAFPYLVLIWLVVFAFLVSRKKYYWLVPFWVILGLLVFAFLTISAAGATVQKEMTKRWLLTEGAGEKTVYAKFFTAYGQASEVVSDSIVYQPKEVSEQSPSAPQQPLPEKAITPPAKKFVFQRNLYFGLRHPDVLQLQKFLNSHGFVLTRFGPGSSGQETNFFGPLTFKALKKFQKAFHIEPTGYFGPKTRAMVNQFLNK